MSIGALPDPWQRPVLTVSEAAPLLRMSERSLRRQLSTGTFPSVGTAPWRVATTEIYVRSGLPIPNRPRRRRLELVDNTPPRPAEWTGPHVRVG